MNRVLPLLVSCLALGLQGRLAAQESAGGNQSSAAASAGATPAVGTAVDIKLKNIFVSLDFSPGTMIEQATTFLSIKSKMLDPQHKGINFIIQPEASTSAKPVSLTLDNVPLGEALRYVCLLANVKYKVQDYAISIVPLSQNTDDLVRRTFIVDPNFVEPPSNVSLNSAAAATFNENAGGNQGGGRPLPQTATPGTGN
jgi:general secretion pathway protein D